MLGVPVQLVPGRGDDLVQGLHHGARALRRRRHRPPAPRPRPTLDWERLLGRFGPHWRVLLAHLILFGFIYPWERAVPGWVMDELLGRLRRGEGSAARRVCRGTLLSRVQYLMDVEGWGFGTPGSPRKAA